jgi:hypothetical protein
MSGALLESILMYFEAQEYDVSPLHIYQSCN